MYFWNIEKLNKDLKKGLSEGEKFKYLLAFTLLGSSLLFIPNEVGFLSFMNSIIEFVGTIILLVVFYEVNGGAKGKDLLSRYFSIGFVSLIRSLLFIMLPLIILYAIVLALVYGTNIPESTTIFDLQMTLIYMVGYFYMNIKYLKQLVKK